MADSEEDDAAPCALNAWAMFRRLRTSRRPEREKPRRAADGSQTANGQAKILKRRKGEGLPDDQARSLAAGDFASNEKTDEPAPVRQGIGVPALPDTQDVN